MPDIRTRTRKQPLFSFYDRSRAGYDTGYDLGTMGTVYSRVVILAACMSACASARSARIAEGTYSVECKRSRTHCYREAARRCPAGFDILDGNSQSGAVVVATKTSQSTATATVIPTYEGELLIQCHMAAAAAKPAPTPVQPEAALPIGPQSNPWDRQSTSDDAGIVDPY